MSDYLHKLPGQHYFFQSYSASFSYYTGETATRLIPILPSEDVQNIRDARWKEKYAMPSITEEEFLKLKKKNRSTFMYQKETCPVWKMVFK